MMKRKIKIILIGLFSLLFMGLVYSLFSTKPEIIADESLRIEEPAIPELESYDERVATARLNSSTLLDGAEAQFSIEATSSEEPLGITNDESIINGNPTPTPVIVRSSTSEPIEKNPVMSEGLEEHSSKPVNDDLPEAAVAESQAMISDDDFLIFEKVPDSDDIKTSEVVENPQPVQVKKLTVIADDSEFLDLNLNEVKQQSSETFLDEEVGQLIFDDINRSLSQFKAHDDVKELNPEVLVMDEPDSKSPRKKALQLPKSTPSVFNMPAVDESLMEGNSELSQQYRNSMSKLISINAKLRDADEENAELKGQFEIAVSQNRVLAQIIRDIDSQIKAFTVTN